MRIQQCGSVWRNSPPWYLRKNNENLCATSFIIYWPCRIWPVETGYPSWLRRPSVSPKLLSWMLKTVPTWVCAFKVRLKWGLTAQGIDFYLTLRRGKNRPSWQQGIPIPLSKFQHVPLWKEGSIYPPKKKGNDQPKRTNKSLTESMS